jgi:outer membrane lipopolysaccharide assembly protein LptE/RlpB
VLFGCGFQLRGTLQQDASLLKLNSSDDAEKVSLYLAVTSKDRSFYRQIKNDLAMMGFEIKTDPEKANNHLIVLASEIDRRVTGVDSNGRNNEFEITHSITFVVNHLSEKTNSREEESSNNQDALDNKTLSVSRYFYVDSNDPIGKSVEEDALLAEMQSQLSRKTIRLLLLSISKSQLASN